MNIFDDIEALLSADDATSALAIVRTSRQADQESETFSSLMNDFLLDLMTMSFVAEAFGGRVLDSSRTLARKRLSKIKLLSLMRSA
ncbi:hypothetical protein [Mesorhizobium sp. WSM3224]|uniref:hypothetical protein n=1 Tax=Mesorhizobium sp. WSM3224 TaxID=1040986 RepID=UPI0004110486|nr:hypothetical protein [Mesorhizobium sp. WSM3224]